MPTQGIFDFSFSVFSSFSCFPSSEEQSALLSFLVLYSPIFLKACKLYQKELFKNECCRTRFWLSRREHRFVV